MFSEGNSKSSVRKNLLSAFSFLKTKNTRTHKHKKQNIKHPCGICKKGVGKKPNCLFL